MEQQQTFSSKQEEIEYLKDLVEKYIEEKQQIQNELEDYVEDSKQLEKELETSLNQAEKKIKELEIENKRIKNDAESSRTKAEQYHSEITRLQSLIESLGTEKFNRLKYIRELEQKNDDLERAERAVAETVAEIEVSLNTVLERNAILESEMDEKETLKEKLQRLVDETRDLRQELSLKEKHVPDNERIVNGGIIDSNRLCVETETQTIPALKQLPTDNRSTRVLALNLVNEILKKMGKLESKISAQRSCHQRRPIRGGTSSSPTRFLKMNGTAFEN